MRIALLTGTAPSSPRALARARPRRIAHPRINVRADGERRIARRIGQRSRRGGAIGRGVNFGNMLEAPTEGAWGLTVTDDFIDKAAAAGFASVRLPVRWSSHASVQPPFTIDPVFLARVESVVDKLLARSVTVVLNMHHYRQLDGDPLDAGEIAVAQAAVDVRFVMLWDQIATNLRGRGPRLVFELYNEPHGRMNGEPWNVLAART